MPLKQMFLLVSITRETVKHLLCSFCQQKFKMLSMTFFCFIGKISDIVLGLKRWENFSVPVLKIRKNTCNPVFLAVLFTIAKTWKQPKCSLIDEWIKKIWYTYTMEYYSGIKKNEMMPSAATWMDLEISILSEVRQRQISYDVTYMWNHEIKKDKNELATKQRETHRLRGQIYGY